MQEKSSSEQIDGIIALHAGWKGETLSRLRAIITAADPAIIEEVKWKMATRPEGLPVWSQNGIVCFAEIWKDNIKLIFSKGSRLADPNKLFNARLKSTEVRAIELHEGDGIDKAALEALVTAAVVLNKEKSSKS
jgi:hypothetical protein